MTNKIEGISAETVERITAAIGEQMYGVETMQDIDDSEMAQCLAMSKIYAQAAITALLASGEVLPKKDVEELVVITKKVLSAYEELDAAIDTSFSDADMELHYTHFANACAGLHILAYDGGPVTQALAKFTPTKQEG